MKPKSVPVYTLEEAVAALQAAKTTDALVRAWRSHCEMIEGPDRTKLQDEYRDCARKLGVLHP